MRKSRFIIGRTDNLGRTDQDFNGGIGKSFGYGFYQTTGQKIVTFGNEIMLAGKQTESSGANNPKSAIFLTRLNENGTFYTMFGGQGFIVRPLLNPQKFVTDVNGLVVDSQKRPIVSGTSLLFNNGYNLFLGGFTNRGNYDHTFGEEGLVYGESGVSAGKLVNSGDKYLSLVDNPGRDNNIGFTVFDRQTGITKNEITEVSDISTVTEINTTIDTDGNIYTGCVFKKGADFGHLIAKFTPDLELDPDFGTAGIQKTVFNSGSMRMENLEILNGKLYVIGQITDRNNTIAIARHNLDGSLDTGFSGDGKRVINYRYLPEVSISSITINQFKHLILCGTSQDKVFLTALEETGEIIRQFGDHTTQVEQGTILYDHFENPESGTNQSYRGRDITIDDKNRIVFTGECWEDVP